MVNTVGSYENKKWQKKWIPIKRSLSLSSTQRSFITGALLDDGTMRIGERAAHANFKVEHGLAQKALVFWQYEILKPFVFTEPKKSFRYHENGERYEKSWWFRTIRHPELTEIYRLFYEGDGYKCGHKVVPKNIARCLTSWPWQCGLWMTGATRIRIWILAHTLSVYRRFSCSKRHCANYSKLRRVPSRIVIKDTVCIFLSPKRKK